MAQLAVLGVVGYSETVSALQADGSTEAATATGRLVSFVLDDILQGAAQRLVARSAVGRRPAAVPQDPRNALFSRVDRLAASEIADNIVTALPSLLEFVRLAGRRVDASAGTLAEDVEMVRFARVNLQ